MCYGPYSGHKQSFPLSCLPRTCRKALWSFLIISTAHNRDNEGRLWDCQQSWQRCGEGGDLKGVRTSRCQGLITKINYWYLKGERSLTTFPSECFLVPWKYWRLLCDFMGSAACLPWRSLLRSPLGIVQGTPRRTRKGICFSFWYSVSFLSHWVNQVISMAGIHFDQNWQYPPMEWTEPFFISVEEQWVCGFKQIRRYGKSKYFKFVSVVIVNTCWLFSRSSFMVLIIFWLKKVVRRATLCWGLSGAIWSSTCMLH